jgi:hypothetical protein
MYIKLSISIYKKNTDLSIKSFYTIVFHAKFINTSLGVHVNHKPRHLTTYSQIIWEFINKGRFFYLNLNIGLAKM